MAADVLNKALPFFLLPYLIHHLSPAEYGVVEYFNACYGFFMLVAAFGFEAWLSANYYSQPEKIPSGLIVGAILSFAITLLILVVTYFYGSVLVGLAVFAGWLQFLIGVRISLFRIAKKVRESVTLLTGQTTLNVLLTLFFFELVAPAPLLRISAIVIALGFAAVYSSCSVCKEYDLGRRLKSGSFRRAVWACLRPVAMFCAPLMPHSLSGWFRGGADRLLIERVLDVESLGVFAVGMQMALVLNVVIASLNQATTPYVMEALSGKADKKAGIRLYNKIFKTMVASCLVVALIVLFLFPPLVRVFLDAKYIEAMPVFVAATLAFSIYSVYMFSVNVIFAIGRTDSLFHITFIVSVFHFILSCGLVYWMNSPLGAAIALMVSNAAISFFVYRKARRLLAIESKQLCSDS